MLENDENSPKGSSGSWGEGAAGACRVAAGGVYMMTPRFKLDAHAKGRIPARGGVSRAKPGF